MKKILIIVTAVSSVLCVASVAALIYKCVREKKQDMEVYDFLPDCGDGCEVNVTFEK